ncbi:hypothetical protein BDGGKGIB_03814 [Nodularia sphaerocarpa UHCC 0038]|nr:hypothetical protein BDGGKGIB_03814 [Nodularia sphaerocarpa UHCC 0038]
MRERKNALTQNRGDGSPQALATNTKDLLAIKAVCTQYPIPNTQCLITNEVKNHSKRKCGDSYLETGYAILRIALLSLPIWTYRDLLVGLARYPYFAMPISR